MPSNIPDNLLIERILKGDKSSFRVLVERYQNMVYTIAYRVTNKREEAEEVAQDAFLKVHNNLQSFEGTAKFSSWLYRIAYNTALTKIRNRKEEPRQIEAFANHIGGVVLNEGEQNFARNDLNMAINLLEPEEATVITLFYLSEQSLDEIAAILNIETNAAKVRLHRARKKLREKLELIG